VRRISPRALQYHRAGKHGLLVTDPKIVTLDDSRQAESAR